MPTMPSGKQAMAKPQELVYFPDESHSSWRMLIHLSGRFLELSVAKGIQMYVYIYIGYQYLCLWLKPTATKTVLEMENNVNGTFCSLQEKIQIRFEQRNLGCFFKIKSLKSPAEFSLRL